ncbi:hypothetical protein K2173_017976 [Erythroxylum novogranatense]|uniref:Uncharacterized protein n=1 Tax=Erythroxylum novogranatense TaxID=1862640 RepID=A0AAV8TU59_9ROSI|nr:hypothetical protein K2173_017976 [Erythroxylum novogranatense]
MAATTAPAKSILTNGSFGSGGGNNINGVNSYGLGSTTVPSLRKLALETGVSLKKLGLETGVSLRELVPKTSPNSSVTQVGLPMSASGGGYNRNGYGLGNTFSK